MSDFLTNLVIRSFSRTPSFQPMAPAEPSYVEPEEPVAEKPPVQNTDKTDQEERLEAAQPTRIEPVPENPKTIESPEPQFTEKSALAHALETPAPNINANAPEIAPTETKPVQPSPVVTSPARQRLEQKPISSPRSSQTTSSPRVRPRQPMTKTRKAEPPIVEQVIEQITEQVIERPAVTIQNRQQITKQEITTQAITSEEITNHEITNQEITNSFTTLVPKPTAQPLPAVNIKTRPNLPAIKPPIETGPPALPPDTVINVAIGRIEVRATPAAAPRRERKSSGPKVMTLDDYVQQRSRGAK